MSSSLLADEPSFTAFGVFNDRKVNISLFLGYMAKSFWLRCMEFLWYRKHLGGVGDGERLRSAWTSIAGLSWDWMECRGEVVKLGNGHLPGRVTLPEL